MRPASLILLLLLAAAGPATGQQRGDPVFVPEIGPPAFAAGAGPRVLLDEAHENFHTLSGRFRTFGRLLEMDGFVIEGGRTPFSAEALADVDLLVIANALNPRNASKWSLPTPSAFTPGEVTAVRDWVRGGGALLLIADHMPFPGAAEALGAAFGFTFSNGFAMDPGGRGGVVVFRRSDGSLTGHPVPLGRGPGPPVDSVAAFTGQAFRSPTEAVDLLVLSRGWVSLLPETAWEFDDSTPRVDVSGWSQGSVLQFGRGRVAVFGEAAMFTAQRAGPGGAPMGMNAPQAGQNARFVANLVRWLTRDR
jgi:hypothetical protein